jgi:hypothetical protein
MSNKFKQMLEQLPTFIILGIAIALIVGVFVMLSYVVVWGLLLGGIIWLVVVIKNYLFPVISSNKHEKGRIIEHDDDK